MSLPTDDVAPPIAQFQEPIRMGPDIWNQTERQRLQELLVKYKELDRKDRRHFVQSQAIPAIKGVFGNRYNGLDQQGDADIIAEWMKKKKVGPSIELFFKY